MNIIIRALEETEDEQVNTLLNLAFQSSVNRLNDIRFYRRLQPDGWFAACMDGRLIGTVGAISYDRFAHVGFMSVHPEMQGQGIGRTLMEHVLGWLRSQHVPLVTLDASNKGFPLYEKLGFVTLDETAIFELHKISTDRGLPNNVQLITEKDLDELVELDTPIFGADRRKVFQSLMKLYASRAFLHRSEDGKITGYLFSQMNRIGPWVMANSGHEEELLKAALTLEYESPVSVCVPSDNQQAVELLEQNGFEKAKVGRHMIKGSHEAPGQRMKVFAQTSLGAG
jgi:ribosomal protein S18 acetylase RimI-like enzyme